MNAKSALLAYVLGAVAVAVAVGCGSQGSQSAVVTKATPNARESTPQPAAAGSIAPAQVAPSTLPDPAAAAPAAAAPARRPGAYANLDPDDDFVVGPPEPYEACEAELAAAGVKFQKATLPVHPEGKSKMLCGAPQVVTFVRGPGNIAYNAPPMLTCTMALALATWERIIQKEATAIFGSSVARIEQLGTYSCREIAAYRGVISEHSYANAIDIGRFVLKNGKSIEVLRDFDVGDSPPSKPAASFLRNVSRRANDEEVFSHVLTPFFNATHNNHFHLDLARYRADGTRPRS